LRSCIIEILHRLPLNESFKPYAADIAAVLLDILRHDNEENSVAAIKVIMDLHKSYKQVLEDQVQPFLDYVLDLYHNMPQAVKDSFDGPMNTPASSTV
jgi:transformation/transcription domain-associated protein